ncbi:MAG TPA: DNA polymerase [Candidatus Paceibacterota bacterium]
MRVVALDCETTGVLWNDDAFLASTAERNDAGELSSRAWELPAEQAELSEYVEGVRLVFHNAKFDLQKFIRAGVLQPGSISHERIEDTEAQAHLLNEHQLKGLKSLAREHLGEETDEATKIREAKKVVAKERKLKLSEISYDMLPREVVIPYAIKDAEYTLRLYELFKPQVEQYEDLSQLYRDEMELALVLLDMESRTMRIDTEYLDRVTREYASRALAKELEIRDLVGDESFNPNSPKQVLEAFALLGLELKATDKVALRSVDHQLAEAILELRHLRKLHGTYLLALQHELQGGEYVHLNFRQHGPKTGRMASGGQEAE